MNLAILISVLIPLIVAVWPSALVLLTALSVPATLLAFWLLAKVLGLASFAPSYWAARLLGPIY